MLIEEVKTKIRWANQEVWVKGNLDALDEIYRSDCVLHSPPLPDVGGLEAMKEHIAGIRSAYSDAQITCFEMIGEGDRIVYRYIWQARHTGQSQTLPIPPPAKRWGWKSA